MAVHGLKHKESLSYDYFREIVAPDLPPPQKITDAETRVSIEKPQSPALLL